QTSTAHSAANITLPKHPKIQTEAENQFEQAQIHISDHAVNEVPNPARANAGFHFVRAFTGSDEKVTSLAFSQNSRMLAVADPGNIKIYDVDSGEELWHTSQNSGTNVTFSPDSKYLARQSGDGSHSVIELVEPQTNQVVSQL